MLAKPGYEVLTHAEGGAVSILRFTSRSLFEKFLEKFIEFRNPSSNSELQYCWLTIDDHQEDCLVLHEPHREIHFHGGATNQEIVCQKIQTLKTEKNDLSDRHLWQSMWEKEFAPIQGAKGIHYMLELKKGITKDHVEQNYDIEGYEYIRPVNIVLTGPVNAGKSSLFNSILGHAHAIVSSHSGTTRDILTQHMTIKGYDVLLSDTAGFLDKKTNDKNELQQLSEEVSHKAISDADILINLGDEWQAPLKPHQLEILVAAKSDLSNDKTPSGRIPVSAKLDKGIAFLLDEIGQKIEQIKKGSISPAFIKN